MQTALVVDDALAQLAALDVVSVGPAGDAAPTWGFLDETLVAAARYGWSFRQAAWAVIASRARRAGCRGSFDVDMLAEAVARHLPGATAAQART